MIRRRAFLVATGAMAMLSLVKTVFANVYEKAIEWFIDLVKALPVSIDAIYRGLLSIKGHYRLLVDDRARLQNVRRELADPSTEKGLQTKLGTWLNHYDAFLTDKQRLGENSEEFAARNNRERAALEQEWKQLRNDAAEALIAVSRIGEELESIAPEAMSIAEWRRFRELISNEKELARFLDTDMPTEPYILARMRETAEQLKRVVQTIDQYAAELDQAIKRAG
jgi:hypothetical protein